MKTADQCRAERDDVGERYIEAARAFVDTFVELQAQSVRLTNAHLNDGAPNGVCREAPVLPVHPLFSTKDFDAGLHRRVGARAAELLTEALGE
jgi:hypothetical protein